MAGPRAALVRGAFWALCCGLAGPASGANFLEAGRVDEQDAAKAFEEELSRLGGSGASDRQLRLEAALRTTYRSLPKNEGGNLGHKAIRYALHRLFVQQHGWYIKGLEPSRRVSGSSQKEWVPSFLEESTSSSGWAAAARAFRTLELAAMASALESLVATEARGRLAAAFELHGLPTEGPGPLDWDEVEDALGTYYLASSFLCLLRVNLCLKYASSLQGARAEQPNLASGAVRIVAQLDHATVDGWEAQDLDEYGTDHKHQWRQVAAMTKNDCTEEHELRGGVAVAVGDQYYKFNDLECLSLKTTLREMESRRAGRVRLSVFYNMSLYSHWRFTEKAEYLRTLGALDDSDAEFPQVIIPNYLTARTNCLEASSLYALCCRNECEDLLTYLEERLAAPEAGAAEIAALVAALPSDTVQAPRELPERLRERLDKIARGNGGAVPIHGRLFAQWMHHAFPNECPYPHEANSTGPVTPDEWVGSSGDESHTVSDEELLRTIEVDTCASDADPSGPCGGATELPWSDTEEPAGGDAGSCPARAPGGGRGS
ncbi:unnamed protein product, partial [Prorocentrum cordatum]